METRDLALFLHILTLLCALGLGSILHAGEWRSRRATTVGELRLHTAVYNWGKLFPVLILALFGTGAWLLHLERAAFTWSTPWVWTALVALGILLVSGGAILGRHAAHFGKVMADTPDGPIPAEVDALAFSPLTWAVSHMNTALAIAVVFNMVNKPDTDIEAILTLVAGALVGTLIGLLGVRRKG